MHILVAIVFLGGLDYVDTRNVIMKKTILLMFFILLTTTKIVDNFGKLTIVIKHTFLFLT